MGLISEVRDFFQIIAAMCLIAGLFLTGYQLMLNRQAALGKNTIDLLNLLMAEHVREARTFVIKNLKKGEPFPFENSEAQQAAATVVSHYEIAAILVREDLVVRAVIVDDSGPSVIVCYERLVEFIEARQKEAGSRYMNDLKNLYEACTAVHNAKGIESAKWTGLA